jgi:hypothetical protein
MPAVRRKQPAAITPSESLLNRVAPIIAILVVPAVGLEPSRSLQRNKLFILLSDKTSKNG